MEGEEGLTTVAACEMRNTPRGGGRGRKNMGGGGATAGEVTLSDVIFWQVSTFLGGGGIFNKGKPRVGMHVHAVAQRLGSLGLSGVHT